MMRNSWRTGILLLWAIALAIALVTGLPQTRFSANVLELLPNADVEVRLLQEFATTEQGRLLVVHLSADAADIQPQAVRAFKDTLTADPTIETIWTMDSSAFAPLGGFMRANRLPLLLPNWLAQHPEIDSANALADRIIENLEQFLDRPDSWLLSEFIPEDPFLLMPELLASLQKQPLPATAEGMILWVEQRDPPFAAAGQEPVFAAMAAASAAAHAVQPDLQVRYTGLARFANASQAAIKSEIQRLNLLCLLAVALIVIGFVRYWRPVARIGLTIGYAMATAAAVVIWSFAEVHILSLVIGSILAGIAVDDGLHLFLEERHGMQRRATTRAVLAASVSSASGFLTLLFAPLDFLQQVGCFVASGLLAALLVAIILRPSNPQTLRIAIPKAVPFALPKWTGPLLLLLLLPGAFRVTWHDSIRALEYPLPELYQQDQEIRAQLGGNNAQPLIIYGRDIAEARGRLAAIEDCLRERGVTHPGIWLPTLAAVKATWDLMSAMPDFAAVFAQQLEINGYDAGAFVPFFADWQTYLHTPWTAGRYIETVANLSATLPGPLANWIHVGDSISAFTVLVPDTDCMTLSAEGQLLLEPRNALNRAFSQYRMAMTGRAGTALAALGIVLLFLLGVKSGSGAICLSLAAVAAAYGLAGWLGMDLGLFHLVGALLAFCISLDFAIFANACRHHDNRMPASVTISALTTAAVFAVLATSPIPAVRALGLTVLVIVALSVLLLLCCWPGIRKRPVLDQSGFELIPHGPEALLIAGKRSLSDNSIEVWVRSKPDTAWAPEMLIEAMAQAAALLLAALHVDETEPRQGMLVLVQSAEMPCADWYPSADDFIRVQLLSPMVAGGILRFQGDLISVGLPTGIPCNVQFSVFVPEKPISQT